MMSDETIYCQRNTEKKKLNRGKRYYENNKERLLEHAKNKYRELSNEKKKHKKRIYMEKISIKICREKTKKE